MLLFSEAERACIQQGQSLGTGCHNLVVGLVGIRKEDGQEVEKLR